MIQRSRSTGAYVFWPWIADHSGACDLEWVEASGGGIVYASAVTCRQASGNQRRLVTLEEGPRMMSCVPGKFRRSEPPSRRGSRTTGEARA